MAELTIGLVRMKAFQPLINAGFPVTVFGISYALRAEMGLLPIPEEESKALWQVAALWYWEYISPEDLRRETQKAVDTALAAPTNDKYMGLLTGLCSAEMKKYFVDEAAVKAYWAGIDLSQVAPYLMTLIPLVYKEHEVFWAYHNSPTFIKGRYGDSTIGNSGFNPSGSTKKPHAALPYIPQVEALPSNRKRGHGREEEESEKKDEGDEGDEEGDIEMGGTEIEAKSPARPTKKARGMK